MPVVFTPSCINESILDKLIKSTNPLKDLENHEGIESLYEVAANAGGTEAPSAQTEIAHHFISFVKHSGRLYLLDGEMRGPICKRKLEEGTPWTDTAFAVIREYINSQDDLGFSLLALVKEVDE
ncbi:hypothetical protein FE257_005948 [Aspergillus nanangensis]|uniref:ubiquitinyl hydrolase 1 n=1 Tax=Aspergillus nanangensis TaxID=2582783 RepID=A0AAD4CAC1_ASPNN|nr:hypothetical protein FE257_005948 [Aspergillus nanangensis]